MTLPYIPWALSGAGLVNLHSYFAARLIIIISALNKIKHKRTMKGGGQGCSACVLMQQTARNVITSVVFVIMFFNHTWSACVCVSAIVSTRVCFVCSRQSSQLASIPVTQRPWHCSRWRTVPSSLQAQPHWIMAPCSAKAFFLCSQPHISCIWLFTSGFMLVRVKMPKCLTFLSTAAPVDISQSWKELHVDFFSAISFTKWLKIQIYNMQMSDEWCSGRTIGTDAFPRALNICVLNKYHHSAAFKACQPP